MGGGGVRLAVAALPRPKSTEHFEFRTGILGIFLRRDVIK